MTNRKTIYAVGIGPGAEDLMTERAKALIAACDTVCGYRLYIDQLQDLLAGKKIISTGMTGEVERCKLALDAVLNGNKVAVVSSGDAGIYGMAGLLYELTENAPYNEIEICTVPGITAANAAAAVLGAPLMNDFAVISLSNLMTPDEVILKRLKALAAAEMVCVIYNPASKKRQRLIKDAVSIFTAHSGDKTFAGVVTNAERDGQKVIITTLKEFPFDKLSMTSVVVIGNKELVYRDNKLYTRRGYRDKYSF